MYCRVSKPERVKVDWRGKLKLNFVIFHTLHTQTGRLDGFAEPFFMVCSCLIISKTGGGSELYQTVGGQKIAIDTHQFFRFEICCFILELERLIDQI